MAALADKTLEQLCVLWKDLPISVSSFADLVEKVRRDGPKSDAAYAMKAVADEITELNEVATAIAEKLLAGEDPGDCQLND